MTGMTRSKRSWSGEDAESGRVKRACSDAEVSANQKSPAKGRATRASKVAKRQTADEDRNSTARSVHAALASRVSLSLCLTLRKYVVAVRQGRSRSDLQQLSKAGSYPLVHRTTLCQHSVSMSRFAPLLSF